MNLVYLLVPLTGQIAPSPLAMDGFLPFGRGSLMLDVVFVTMFVIVPLLAVSLWLVKYRRNYQLHKTLQLTMGSVLLVAVLLFEIDMQLFTEWEQRAEPSPYFDLAHKWSCLAGRSLIIHLCFAVPTLLLWIVVVVQALRKFSRPPTPGPHSQWHARWATLAAIGMFMTAVTGWIFYWLAFVATK
jgi:putative membrane protein